MKELFEKYGAKKTYRCGVGNYVTDDCPLCMSNPCDECIGGVKDYPKITPEKVDNLIEFLPRYQIHKTTNTLKYQVTTQITGGICSGWYETKKEAVTELFKQLHEHFSDEEKQQVKGILER